MNDHLSKPFRMEILDKTLKKWMKVDAKITNPVQPKFKKERVNFDTVTVLQRDAGDQFNELLDMFVAEIPQKLVLMEKAINSREHKEVGEIAHKLKSNCATFGAVKLADICVQIEESVLVGITKETANLVKLFETESKPVLKALKDKFMDE